MPRININILVLSGCQYVDTELLTNYLTASYLPNIEVDYQNGCMFTKTQIQANYIESLSTRGSKGSLQQSNTQLHYADDQFTLDISFATLNPKLHLWSKLRSQQLFTDANIALLVYNADDKESFDKLNSIYKDLQEVN